jgi:hypothetical protein
MTKADAVGVRGQKEGRDLSDDMSHSYGLTSFAEHTLRSGSYFLIISFAASAWHLPDRHRMCLPGICLALFSGTCTVL